MTKKHAVHAEICTMLKGRYFGINLPVFVVNESSKSMIVRSSDDKRCASRTEYYYDHR